MSSSPQAERLHAAPATAEPPRPRHRRHGRRDSAARPRWATPGSWTLRSKLVASMLILFFVVSVVTGAATVLFLRQVLDEPDRPAADGLDQPDPRLGIPTAGRGGPGDQGLIAALSTDGSFTSRGMRWAGTRAAGRRS